MELSINSDPFTRLEAERGHVLGGALRLAAKSRSPTALHTAIKQSEAAGLIIRAIVAPALARTSLRRTLTRPIAGVQFHYARAGKPGVASDTWFDRRAGSAASGFRFFRPLTA
jgi:hypothetical protein